MFVVLRFIFIHFIHFILELDYQGGFTAKHKVYDRETFTIENILF